MCRGDDDWSAYRGDDNSSKCIGDDDSSECRGDDDSSEYRGDDDLVDRLDTSHNISQDYDDYHDFNNLYDWEVVFLMLGLRLIRSQQNNPFAYFEINFYLLGIL